MDPFTKDLVQVAAWCVAVIGGLIAAFKPIHEIAENRRLRSREWRWKKAQLAREILDRFDANRRLNEALTMLDWTGREFEISPGQRVEISWEDLPDALRVWKAPISVDDKQVYIRDCFDELFYGMSQLEHSLRTGLLEFADVEFPMAYNVGKLRERWAAVAVFLNQYGYDLVLAFIKRFPVRLEGG